MIMIKILGDKVRPINVRTYVYHYYLYSVSQKTGPYDYNNIIIIHNIY